jgi:hypothetical protein
MDDFSVESSFEAHPTGPVDFAEMPVQMPDRTPDYAPSRLHPWTLLHLLFDWTSERSRGEKQTHFLAASTLHHIAITSHHISQGLCAFLTSAAVLLSGLYLSRCVPSKYRKRGERHV